MTIKGLTSAEVEQNKALGSNKLTEVPRDPFWKVLLEAFKDPIIEILCVALIVNLIFAILGYSSWVEPIGIALAVILATLVGSIPEYKNEGAFQKLKADASKIICRVYRDGVLSEIFIDDIVCNDVVHLQSGDKVPADGHIINGSIKVDQSVLNGEAKEAQKETVEETEYDVENKDFLDKQSVYRGTIVSSGIGDMVVDVVGDTTEYGKIAQELQEETDRETPLKLKLSKLANGIKWFGYIGGIAIALAIIVMGIYKSSGGLGETGIIGIVQIVVNAVITAMALIVMAVPEGLPLLISLVSALNMKKMLADKILVRVRDSIETAGSLNILFSDKTGTITKNKLEAVAFVTGDGKQVSRYTDLSKEIKDLYRYCAIGTSEANITVKGNELHVVGSNPTDRAIVQFTGVHAKDDGDMDIVQRVEFSSANKYSGAQLEGKCAGTYIKGAVEKVLSMCESYYDSQGNKVSIDKKVSDGLERKVKELAGRMIRVLAIARTDEKIDSKGELPVKEYTLIGLVGVRDEVRPEAKVAIEKVKNADIQVVMITGDSADTAVAIAKEVNLIENDNDYLMIEKAEDADKFSSSNPKEVAITSKALNSIEDDKLKEMIPFIRVIARAVPTDKSRMVTLSQELDKVVGMTGDGGLRPVLQ